MAFFRFSAPLLGVLSVLCAQQPSYALAPPSGFPSSGNGLWYTTPGSLWSREYLPIGNGYLGAMLAGGSVQETTQLNIESLWSGGPFADPTYNGGNKLASEQSYLAQYTQASRQAIFQSSNGTIHDIGELQQDPGAYGSYSTAGYLLSTLLPTSDGAEIEYNYARWLDLDEAVARTQWTVTSATTNTTYLRESFCSFTSQSCTQHLSSSSPSPLPTITYAYDSMTITTGLPPPNITCFDSHTLLVRGYVAIPGMLYEMLFRAQGDGVTTCSSAPPGPEGNTTFGVNATLTVQGATESWITWVGGTEYNIDAGDAAHGFSFLGPDPHASLLALLPPLTSSVQSYESAYTQHVSAYNSLMTPFSLSLSPASSSSFAQPTDQLIAAYQTDVGNPYIEQLLFNYGRYLLASSALGVLPANLQGVWAQGSGNPWSADANINLQMNYWMVESTFSDSTVLTQSLWDYMENTWAPRGAYTAEVLYNISQGWVTHDEVFGHTGMKAYGDPSSSAEWADYPVVLTTVTTLQMIHVYDHFDYTNDVEWWRAQGWPLLKAVAQFHMQRLIPDNHFNDSSLVVAPCNSPEQLPITFGCAHAQELIWQLFNAVEKGFEASGDTDTSFLAEVQAKRTQMDKGIHIGYWGQLQEWKFDMDQQNDTHRHLSHLVGLYPGYAVSGYDPTVQGNPVNYTYTHEDVIQAATVSLLHRGNGTGPDGDAGWEKVWRAAGWAQFGDAESYYHQLTYAIERNFGANLFSLYDPLDTSAIFQIDANLGYPAAVMNALLQAPDVPSLSTPLTITLLPALPAAWSAGHLKGAMVRGGISVDMSWESGNLTGVSFAINPGALSRPVQVVYGGKVVKEFVTGGGMVVTLSM
ncbi:glycoside hydrolase family 95 protein [Jaapia argillacea MUCL 33604]|uniref:Glycoside hydrolase family 95 protein n=1 Tax=Jaapia argillacea MUCL 33604 TaxID=933084 RepID=A0A067PGC1_9AGAM|nr:glycoside hydrolase family 95 protein [Jaapia argillacea MUCL 33604]